MVSNGLKTRKFKETFEKGKKNMFVAKFLQTKKKSVAGVQNEKKSVAGVQNEKKSVAGVQESKIVKRSTQDSVKKKFAQFRGGQSWPSTQKIENRHMCQPANENKKMRISDDI